MICMITKIFKMLPLSSFDLLGENVASWSLEDCGGGADLWRLWEDVGSRLESGGGKKFGSQIGGEPV